MLNWQLIVAWLNHWAAWLFAAGMAVLISFHIITWLQRRKLAHSLREQKPPPYALSATPQVSVLVPAWNEAALIERHIQAFLALRYPHKELILSAGGEDGTLEIARRYAGRQVIILEQSRGEGKQRALRNCLEEASGAIIFLTDADNLLDDEAFERTLAPLIKERAKAVSGMTRPLPEQMNDPFALYQWYAEQYGAISLGTFTPLIRGCNGAISREALEAAGGFKGMAIIGTDDDLTNKLHQQGMQICFVRDSQVANEYPYDFKSYLQQQSRWLRVAILRGLRRKDSGIWLTIIGFLVYALPILLLSASLFIGKISVYAALLLLIHMFCTRLQIVSFGLEYVGGNFFLRYYPRVGLYLFFDFCVRGATIFHFLWPRARRQW